MPELKDVINKSIDLQDFITNFNREDTKNPLTRTVFKPKNCKFAYQNEFFFVTDCHSDTYDKAGTETRKEYEEMLTTLQKLKHESLIKLYEYDINKGIIVWENVKNFYPLHMSEFKFNLLNSPFVKAKDMQYIKEQVDDVANYLDSQGLTHLDFEVHNIGFNEYTKKIKVFDMLSVKKKSEKYTGLFDRGDMNRPDLMHPPFIKFFDAKAQFILPKTLVLGKQEYSGKPCLDSLMKDSKDLGIQIARDFMGDYYNYLKLPTIYTLYENVIIVLSLQERQLFFSNFSFFNRLQQICHNIIFLDEKKHLRNVMLDLTRKGDLPDDK